MKGFKSDGRHPAVGPDQTRFSRKSAQHIRVKAEAHVSGAKPVIAAGAVAVDHAIVGIHRIVQGSISKSAGDLTIVGAQTWRVQLTILKILQEEARAQSGKIEGAVRTTQIRRRPQQSRDFMISNAVPIVLVELGAV